MPRFSYQLIVQKNALRQAKTLFDLGYNSVELMIPKPDNATEEICKKILNIGISISAIGTGLAAKQGLTLK